MKNILISVHFLVSPLDVTINWYERFFHFITSKFFHLNVRESICGIALTCCFMKNQHDQENVDGGNVTMFNFSLLHMSDRFISIPEQFNDGKSLTRYEVMQLLSIRCKIRIRKGRRWSERRYSSEVLYKSIWANIWWRYYRDFKSWNNRRKKVELWMLLLYHISIKIRE